MLLVVDWRLQGQTVILCNIYSADVWGRACTINFPSIPQPSSLPNLKPWPPPPLPFLSVIHVHASEEPWWVGCVLFSLTAHINVRNVHLEKQRKVKKKKRGPGKKEIGGKKTCRGLFLACELPDGFFLPLYLRSIGSLVCRKEADLHH